jgi:hypothetical protein
MGRHFPRIDHRKRFILNLDIVNNQAEDLPNDAVILKAARIDTALEYDCVGHERRYSVLLGWRQRGVSAQNQETQEEVIHKVQDSRGKQQSDRERILKISERLSKSRSLFAGGRIKREDLSDGSAHGTVR